MRLINWKETGESWYWQGITFKCCWLYIYWGNWASSRDYINSKVQCYEKSSQREWCEIEGGQAAAEWESAETQFVFFTQLQHTLAWLLCILEKVLEMSEKGSLKVLENVW